MKLKDKVAVITGGSKGIGKAIAALLAGQGCKIAIASRNEKDLKRAEAELSRDGAAVLTAKVDVRNIRDVEALAENVHGRFGPAHILVNNAGIGRFVEVAQMKDKDFRDVMETNLFGVFYCTRTFLPQMIENGGGHIINIASLAGKNSFASGAAYCASKHGLIAFGECLMLEIRHHNIKVSTICPGSVRTEFSPESTEKTWALTADDVGNAVLDVLQTSDGSLISMVDLRPLRPPKH